MASRDTKKAYLERAGFLPAERNELSRTSKAGMYAPYYQRMIRSRRAIYQNAKRNRWTEYHYRQHIREVYEDKGILGVDERWNKNMVWALLRWYQEQYPPSDEYESPHQKRLARKRGIARRKKKVTRLDMITQRIAELDRRIPRVKSEARRQKMFEQRALLVRQAERLS
jgi:hypothetical protein